MSHKSVKTLAEPRIELGTFVVGRQRSYQLRQLKAWSIVKFARLSFVAILF